MKTENKDALETLKSFSQSVLLKTFEIRDIKYCQLGNKFQQLGKSITGSKIYEYVIDPNDEKELKYAGITSKVDKNSFKYGIVEYKIEKNDKNNTITISNTINKKYLTKNKNNQYEFYYLNDDGKKNGIVLIFDEKGKIIKKNFYINGKQFDCRVLFNKNAQLSNIDNYMLICRDNTRIKINGTTRKIKEITTNNEGLKKEKKLLEKPLKLILEKIEEKQKCKKICKINSYSLDEKFFRKTEKFFKKNNQKPFSLSQLNKNKIKNI